jgi:hypothetical protein
MQYLTCRYIRRSMLLPMYLDFNPLKARALPLFTMKGKPTDEYHNIVVRTAALINWLFRPATHAWANVGRIPHTLRKTDFLVSEGRLASTRQIYSPLSFRTGTDRSVSGRKVRNCPGCLVTVYVRTRERGHASPTSRSLPELLDALPLSSQTCRSKRTCIA